MNTNDLLPDVGILPQRLTLNVVKHEENPYLRVSSSRSYDYHMSSIFPYHVKVSHEEGMELSGLLSRGAKHGENLEYEFYPSFALLMNFERSYGPKGGKVLWMSAASLQLLEMHPDLYDIVITDNTKKLGWED